MTRKLFWTLAALLLAGLVLYELQRPTPRAPGTEQTEVVPALGEGLVPEERLSDMVRPRAYRLRLAIDPERPDFSGRVEIDITVDAPVEQIWLHAKDLAIERAVLLTSGGETIRAAAHQATAHGLMALALERPLNTARATILIEYKGAFNDAFEGLYRVRSGGDWYVITQFQPTAARLAFPAFDDPALQAPVRLSLRLPVGLEAISNMPAISERRLADGERLVIFAPTPPLPTYLVALAVGPFDRVVADPIPPNNVRRQPLALRGFAPRGEAAGLSRALGETADFLAALENYTGEPYPYAKLDLVAAPGFFGRGIGNPGALFHDARVVLLGDNPPIDRLRQFYASHMDDLAHQWFGGLVTPRWWNDNWLSESFAAWLGARLLNELRPDLRFGREIQRGAERAMASDSMPTAMPLRQPVRTEAEIASAFSPAVIDKGAAILSMFEQYMGPNRFRAAIRRYLGDHLHGTATTADFVRAVNEVQKDETLSAAFRSFLDQAGVPDVTLDWSCEGDGVAVDAAYHRHWPLGVALPDDAASWQIPICLRLLRPGERGSVACMLVTRPKQTFYLREQACPVAVVPNAGGRGYYRWSMPLDRLRELAPHLNQMQPGEVLSFAQSLSSAFRKGTLSPGDYLRMLRPVTETALWDAATLPMEDMRFLLRHGLAADAPAEVREQVRGEIADLYRARLEHGFESMGKPGDILSTEERKLRLGLLEFFVVDLGDPFFRERLAAEGRAYAEALEAGRGRLAGDPDLLRTALAAAVLEDGEPLARELAEMLDDLNDPALREDIFHALANSRDRGVLDGLLQLLARGALTAGERTFLVGAMSDNPAAAEALWMWSQGNPDALSPRLLEEVMGVAGGFCSAEQRVAVEEFFTSRATDPKRRRLLDQALGQIDHCIALSEWVRFSGWPGEAAVPDGE